MTNKVYTKMKLSGLHIPLRADDEISVQVRQIDEAGDFVRTVNGDLIRLSRSAFDRFAVSISGQGINAPALSTLTAGQYIEISLPDPVYARLTVALGSVSSGTFPRAVVDVEAYQLDGTRRAVDQPMNYETSMTTVFSAARVAAMRAPVICDVRGTSAHAVRGRLVLACRVVSWSIDTEDASKETSWSLELEEA